MAATLRAWEWWERVRPQAILSVPVSLRASHSEGWGDSPKQDPAHGNAGSGRH